MDPSGLTPAEVRQAYSFNDIVLKTAKGKGVAGDGSGQTIAIVSAYHDPTIAADLRAFDAKFGISNKAARGGFALTVMMPQGHLPNSPEVLQNTANWAQETSLDVEWAHAMAPGARILLVETKDDAPADLFAGVNFARKRRGVTVISMSFGWDSLPAGINPTPILTTPANHIGAVGRGDGITFFEAGSDDGVAAAFPGPSVNVVSVGATELKIDSAGNYISETPLPQSAAPSTVAYNGDPNLSYAVYDSTPDQGTTGWQLAAGTSAGAPQWAALFAIADEGRALLHKHSLDTATNTLPALASLPSTDFHAVTNGGASTGRGSPFANRLIADLITI